MAKLYTRTRPCVKGLADYAGTQGDGVLQPVG